MNGESSDTCMTCGAAYLTGCVISGECPGCESERMTLESAGWKVKQHGFGTFQESTWEDPKFPGTICKKSEALLLQEGRTIEQIKKLSK